MNNINLSIKIERAISELRRGGKVVITDNNNIPVNVEIDNFQEGISNTYFQASNKYFVEYDKLISNRSVEGIIET